MVYVNQCEGFKYMNYGLACKYAIIIIFSYISSSPGKKLVQLSDSIDISWFSNNGGPEIRVLESWYI